MADGSKADLLADGQDLEHYFITLNRRSNAAKESR
jgi:hypothetical protein